MAERLRHHPEQHADAQELEAQGAEQHERIREEVERQAETSKERSVEDARHEVEKITVEKERREQEHARKAPAEKRKDRPVRNANTLDASFNARMKEVRADMSAPSRAFSKVIHNKAVEKASEAIGTTIARPNAILSGSVSALVLTAGLFFWAQYNGYPLSGFETIGAFIIGWLLGIIFDFARIMFTGKQ